MFKTSESTFKNLDKKAINAQTKTQSSSFCMNPTEGVTHVSYEDLKKASKKVSQDTGEDEKLKTFARDMNGKKLTASSFPTSRHASVMDQILQHRKSNGGITMRQSASTT